MSDFIILAIVIVVVLVMFVKATLAIRAGISSPDELEINECVRIQNIGGDWTRRERYDIRCKKLKSLFRVGLSLFITLVPLLVLAVVALVSDMRDAPYDFAAGRVKTAFWPPFAVLVITAGLVVTLVMWVRAYRRLKVVKALPSYMFDEPGEQSTT
jgi:hypothetical protein